MKQDWQKERVVAAILACSQGMAPVKARTHNLNMGSFHCLSSTEAAVFYHTGAHSWHRVPPIEINGS